MLSRIPIQRRRQGGLAYGALALAFMQTNLGQALETSKPQAAKGEWIYVDMAPGSAKLGWGDPAEEHFDGIRMECSSKKKSVLMVIDVDPKGAKRAKATVSRGTINLVVQGPVEEGPLSPSINGNISFNEFNNFAFQGGDIVISSSDGAVSYSPQKLEIYLPKFIKACGITATPQTQQVVSASTASSAEVKTVSNKNATTLEYIAIWSRIHPNIFTDRSIYQTLLRSVFCNEYRYSQDEFQRREKLDALQARIRAAANNPPAMLTDISITYPLGEYDFSFSGFSIKITEKRIRDLGVSKESCWPEQTPLFFVPEDIWFIPQPGQFADLLKVPREIARDLIKGGRPSYRVSFDLRVTGANNYSGIMVRPFLGLKGDIQNFKYELVGADGKVVNLPAQ